MKLTARDLIDRKLLEDYRYHLEETKDGKWFWSLVARNGEPIANSEQLYVNKSDCERGLRMVKMSGDVPVIEKPYR